MDNTEENDENGVTLIGRTIRDDNKNSTALIIPKEFVRLMDIENSKVSMSVLEDFEGDRYLIVSKFHNEIVME